MAPASQVPRSWNRAWGSYASSTKDLIAIFVIVIEVLTQGIVVGASISPTFSPTAIPSTAPTASPATRSPTGHRHPIVVQLSDTVSSLNGQRMYSTCSTANDGRVFCAPRTAASVVAVDTLRNSSYFLPGSYDTSVDKYVTSALAGDGIIYAAPYNAERVLAIDPYSNTSFLFGKSYVGTAQYLTSTKANDGRIFCAPYSKWNVLVIDPAQNTTYLLNELKYNATTSKYRASALAGDGRIYAVPYDASRVLVMDPFLNMSYTLATEYADRWAAVAKGNDGRLWAPPYSGTKVLRINPHAVNGSLSTSNVSASGITLSSQKYASICLAGNGHLFAAPLGSDYSLEIDPADNATSFWSSEFHSSFETFKACAAVGDGRIIMIPYSSQFVYYLNPYDNPNHKVAKPVFNPRFPPTSDYESVAVSGDGIVVSAPYDSQVGVILIDSQWAPSMSPTEAPSVSPSTSSPTTVSPSSLSPTTVAPSRSPLTLSPTSASPVTAMPTSAPSQAPTGSPSTHAPTLSPFTIGPSSSPSLSPSTLSPSVSPTASPRTMSPATSAPTVRSHAPTVTLSPSCSPSSASPSLTPMTNAPATCTPTAKSVSPVTMSPFTDKPSFAMPTNGPTRGPTRGPSIAPAITITPNPSSSPRTSSPTTVAPTNSPVTVNPTSTSPRPVSAVMKDDLLGFDLTFDFATAQPALTCDQLFATSTLATLGTNPACTWKSPLKLFAAFGSDASVIVGTIITVNGDVVPGISGPAYFFSTDVTLGAPANPPAVTISIVGPSSVGLCSKVVLTVTPTSYAGRLFQLSWGYHSTVAGTLSNVTTFVSSSTGPMIELDAIDLGTGSHNFSITARDWIGQNSMVFHQIDRVATYTPSVIVGAPTYVSQIRSNTVAIRTRLAAPDGCSVSGTTTGSWKQVFPTEGFISPSASQYASSLTTAVASLINPNSILLNVAANTLNMGSTYGFTFFGYMLDTSGNVIGEANQTYVINIVQQPVVARIDGGETRTVPVITKQDITVTFDASGSYDPADLSLNLQYQWALFDVSAPDIDVLSTNSISATSAILSLSTSILSALKSYAVKVNVTGMSIGGVVRASTASQILHTLDVEVPIALVASSAASQTRARTDTELSLAVSVANYNISQVSIRWSNPSGNFDLSQPQNLLSTTAAPTLVLAANTLQQGVRYSFQASVTNSLGATGNSSMSFVTNNAPSLGSCFSEPSSGTQLQTIFNLQCAGWADSDGDLPLRYRFQADTSGSGAYIDLSGVQELEIHSTQLPASSSGSSNVTIRARILDSLAETTTVTFSVSVATSTIDIASTTTQINSLLGQGDISTSSIYLSSSAIQLASTTTASPAATAIVNGQRNSLISSISVLASSSESTGEDGALDTAALLLQTVTTTDSSAPLDTGSLSLALAACETLSNSTLLVTGEAPESIVGAFSNIITAPIETETERADTARRAEASMQIIGSNILKGTTAGQTPVEVSQGNITITSTRLDTAAGGTMSISSSASGAAVNLSSSLVYPEVLDVVTIMSSPITFPGNNSITGVYSIELKTSGSLNVIQIPSATNPFELFIPFTEDQLAAFKASGRNATCKFWNTTSLSWDGSGVEFQRIVSTMTKTGIACKSYHLTSFAGAEDNSDVSVGVNTFSASDINASAFSWSNPVMVMCTVLFAIFLIGAQLISMQDQKEREKNGVRSSVEFWRKMNYGLKESIAGDRNWKNTVRHTKWAVRSRHVWLAVVTRHAGDYMTGLKRWTILMTLLFNGLTIVALLVGQEQSLPGVTSTFATSLVAALFGFPVPFIATTVFKRHPPKDLAIKIENEKMSGLGVLTPIFLWCMGDINVDFGAMGGIATTASNAGAAQDIVMEIVGGLAEGEDVEMEDFAGDDNDVKEEELDEKARMYYRRHSADFNWDAMAVGQILGAEAGVIMNVQRKEKEGEEAKDDDREVGQMDVEDRAQFLLIEAKRNNHFGEDNLEGIEWIEAAVQRSVWQEKLRKEAICYGVYPTDAKYLTNHDYTIWDVVGLAILVTVMLGCWFILAVLSVALGENSYSSVFTSLVSFVQDFSVRLLIIVFVGFLNFAPAFACWACLFGAMYKDDRVFEKYDENDADFVELEFLPGPAVGFLFKDKRILKIKKYSQARKLGVKEGWVVSHVADEVVATDDAVYKAIQECHRLYNRFRIRFKVGQTEGKEDKEATPTDGETTNASKGNDKDMDAKETDVKERPEPERSFKPQAEAIEMGDLSERKAGYAAVPLKSPKIEELQLSPLGPAGELERDKSPDSPQIDMVQSVRSAMSPSRANSGLLLEGPANSDLNTMSPLQNSLRGTAAPPQGKSSRAQQQSGQASLRSKTLKTPKTRLELKINNPEGGPTSI